MSVNKIVLKGTGRMSLHERFTKLKFDNSGGRAAVAHKPIKSEVIHIDDEYTPTPIRGRQGYTPSSTTRQGYTPASSARQGYTPPTSVRQSRHRTRTPDQPKYNTRRMRSLSPMTRMRQAISPAEPRRSQYNDRSSSTMFSSNRVNKKSVYLRLGVRQTNRSLADRMSSGIPVWAKSRQSNWERGGGGGGGWRMSRSASTQSLNRWSSQGSLNSYEIPRYQMNNNRRFRGRGFGGGNRRNYAYNRAGRWRYGQGWFGRRNRGGNRGGGNFRGGWTSRFRRQPPPKKEDLDAELDKYMAGTRGVLDRELDTYMSESKS